jgi:heat shock protein HtpX
MGLSNFLFVFVLTAIPSALIFASAIFALGYGLYAYYSSDEPTRNKKKAISIGCPTFRLVSKSEAPELYRLLCRLCQNAGLPVPKLYIASLSPPDIVTAGRNPQRSVIMVTEGLLKLLDQTELEGMLAHQLARIKSRAAPNTTIAESLALVASTFVIYWMSVVWVIQREEIVPNVNLVGAVEALIIAVAVLLVTRALRAAIFRNQTYAADIAGARMVGTSEGLVGALLKLERSAPAPRKVDFLFGFLFTSPLSGGVINPPPVGILRKFFSAYPLITDRVQKLQNSNL